MAGTDVNCPGFSEVYVFNTLAEAEAFFKASTCTRTPSKCPNKKPCEKLGGYTEETIKGVTFGVAHVVCLCPEEKKEREGREFSNPKAPPRPKG
jgi:hypothetical protein